MLYRLGIPYAGAGGPVWGWELKNSYFRPFFVKIRSFSTFGALNPQKCPNKPNPTTSHTLWSVMKLMTGRISELDRISVGNRATGFN